MNRWRPAWVFFVAGGLLLAIFGLLSRDLSRAPRAVAGSELLVTLPIVAQVVLAGGDRYLAANLATFRALVASTEAMNADDFALQAKIQADAAWLNPAQEDNYYIAAAVLPWYGQLEASQYVLRRASDARPFDWQPPFYYAFNVFYFLKDPAEGARWLRKAAEHTDVEDHVLAFQQIAAVWAAKGPDLEAAIKFHRDLIKATKHREFAAFLEKRVMRLENFLQIEKAVASYRQNSGSVPADVEELVRSGTLSAIPVDPFGLRYVLDADGRAKAQVVARGTQGGVR
jgi:tetratricopeptide (TPR) repeat protein